MKGRILARADKKERQRENEKLEFHRQRLALAGLALAEKAERRKCRDSLEVYKLRAKQAKKKKVGSSPAVRTPQPGTQAKRKQTARRKRKAAAVEPPAQGESHVPALTQREKRLLVANYYIDVMAAFGATSRGSLIRMASLGQSAAT